MPANTVHCHVLNGNVTIVSDLNGNVTNVICPELRRITNGCKAKRRNAGFVGSLLGIYSDQTHGTRHAYCEFLEPIDLY